MCLCYGSLLFQSLNNESVEPLYLIRDLIVLFFGGHTDDL